MNITKIKKNEQKISTRMSGQRSMEGSTAESHRYRRSRHPSHRRPAPRSLHKFPLPWRPSRGQRCSLYPSCNPSHTPRIHPGSFSTGWDCSSPPQTSSSCTVGSAPRQRLCSGPNWRHIQWSGASGTREDWEQLLQRKPEKGSTGGGRVWGRAWWVVSRRALDGNLRWLRLIMWEESEVFGCLREIRSLWTVNFIPGLSWRTVEEEENDDEGRETDSDVWGKERVSIRVIRWLDWVSGPHSA